MLCSHNWTVTSECPKCLRAQLDNRDQRWHKFRQWLEAQAEDSTTPWAGVSARTAFRDAVDRMDWLEDEYP